MKQQQQTTESAYDGQQALNKIRSKTQNPCLKCNSNNFQLIFLFDINMPNKDGVQTVREIQKNGQKWTYLKCLLCCYQAFCDHDTKQRSYDAGMDIYQIKPLNLSILRSLIHQVFKKETYVKL